MTHLSDKKKMRYNKSKFALMIRKLNHGVSLSKQERMFLGMSKLDMIRFLNKDREENRDVCNNEPKKIRGRKG